MIFFKLSQNKIFLRMILRKDIFSQILKKKKNLTTLLGNLTHLSSKVFLCFCSQQGSSEFALNPVIIRLSCWGPKELSQNFSIPIQNCYLESLDFKPILRSLSMCHRDSNQYQKHCIERRDDIFLREGKRCKNKP
jgi:hypothetical protein